jgi:integrase
VSIKALKKIDEENTRPKRRKGFNLVPRESKKHGTIYYARFTHNGTKLKTKFCTHQSDIVLAEKWALENKDRLIEQYLSKKDGRLYVFLEEFYTIKENSLESEKIEVMNLTYTIRNEYKAVIKNKFIPFLKQANVMSLEQITPKILSDFQDYLLSGKYNGKYKKIKPQSVNKSMKAVRKIFVYLSRKHMIKFNPCNDVKALPVHEKDQRARGCYELEKINGIFNKRWEKEELSLLCLLIYTTGMRNSEIKRLEMSDIETVNGCRFINIKTSKTKSGIRKIPLHDKVYRKLKAYAEKSKKTRFLNFWSKYYKDANKELARQLKISDEELEKENITFYSGRHFWKTLMRVEGLGDDIEKIWMGHKVSGNVAENYTHLNKQGKERTIKKAKQMFEILDRCIFNTKP